MKGNEKTIGIIIGVVLTILGSVLGLQSDTIKAGICNPSAEVAK